MYYQLESDEPGMTAYVTRVAGSSGSLVRGRFIDPADEQLPFRYTYRDPTGKPLYDYYSGKSLMSKRLIAALEKAGVDNLQQFETELVDETTGAVRNDYSIVNIVGLVSCANIEESTTSELGSSYYFHDLVIDPRKIGDLLMFRLKESMINVLVEEKVAQAIKSGDFRGVLLTPVDTAPNAEVG